MKLGLGKKSPRAGCLHWHYGLVWRTSETRRNSTNKLKLPGLSGGPRADLLSGPRAWESHGIRETYCETSMSEGVSVSLSPSPYGTTTGPVHHQQDGRPSGSVRGVDEDGSVSWGGSAVQAWTIRASWSS